MIRRTLLCNQGLARTQFIRKAVNRGDLDFSLPFNQLAVLGDIILDLFPEVDGGMFIDLLLNAQPVRAFYLNGLA